jgi:hypothetical protein
MVWASGDTVTSTKLNHANLGPVYNVKDPAYGAVGDGSTDDFTAINSAISGIKGAGGGVLYFPKSSGSYMVSSDLSIDFSNVNIVLDNPVMFTSTETGSGFLIGVSGTDIENVVFDGRGNIVDGNGSARSSTYSYIAGDGHAAIKMDDVVGFAIRDVVVKNGLVNCLLAKRCKNGVIDNVSAFSSQLDNGISVNKVRTDFAQGDFSTYNNIELRNCRAWNNVDYGITAFNCAGVRMIDCISSGNGNSDANQVHNGGGGFSMEDNNSTPNTTYYRNSLVNCHASDNTGKGIFVDCNQVDIVNCSASNTTYGGTDASHLEANGLYIVAAKDVSVLGGSYSSNWKGGIKALANSGYSCEITLDSVTANGNSRSGIELRNCESVRLRNCSTESNKEVGTHIVGGTELSGEANIDGLTTRYNGDDGLFVTKMYQVTATNIAGLSNATDGSAQGADFQSIVTLIIDDVHMLDPAGNQTYGVLVRSDVSTLYLTSNVTGDGTTSDFSEGSSLSFDL